MSEQRPPLIGLSGRHPGTLALLRWFEFAHLPAELARTSQPFHDLAHDLVRRLPDSAELTAGLRKLVEAKDCAVRATLDARQEAEE